MLLQIVLFHLSVLLRYRSQLSLVHRARIQKQASLDFKRLSPFGLFGYWILLVLQG